MIMTYAMAANQFAGRGECADALRPICEMLGITPYRLGRLLDMEAPHNVYRWFNGDVRPSQRYCIRMMRLMQMGTLGGVKFRFVDRIEWPEGKIIWKVDNWNDKSDSRVSPGKRQIPKSNEPYGVPMAEFLDQPSR